MASNCKDCRSLGVSGDDEPCASCYPSMNRPGWAPIESKRDKVGDHLRHQRRKHNGADPHHPTSAELKREANDGT